MSGIGASCIHNVTSCIFHPTSISQPASSSESLTWMVRVWGCCWFGEAMKEPGSLRYRQCAREAIAQAACKAKDSAMSGTRKSSDSCGCDLD